ncbi:integrase catalytic domain-containing protein [Trichonephila clavipes]|nr:integrase catalytic domain-containing protein [Trichonephila clavipes]
MTVNSLAIYSAIRHLGICWKLEISQCLLTTSLTYALGKKVTSVLHGRSVSWISSLSSPQILYTFQDLTILLLMFSLVFLQSPSQVKLTMTVLLRHNRLIRSFTPNSIWNFLGTQKVTFPNSSTEIMCDLSTGTARPYIPKQHRQDVFLSAMHNLSHPGIRRSVHLMKQRFVWPSISSDVAKWARHCSACQKIKIHRHTRSPLSSFQESFPTF